MLVTHYGHEWWQRGRGPHVAYALNDDDDETRPLQNSPIYLYQEGPVSSRSWVAEVHVPEGETLDPRGCFKSMHRFGGGTEARELAMRWALEAYHQMLGTFLFKEVEGWRYEQGRITRYVGSQRYDGVHHMWTLANVAESMSSFHVGFHMVGGFPETTVDIEDIGPEGLVGLLGVLEQIRNATES